MATTSMPTMPCNERVGSQTVTYPCSLEVGHAGPHYAVEVRASVNARNRWQDAQRHAASGLGEFQGFPQTTAERYTDGATPVPQSVGVLRADAAEAQARQHDITTQAGRRAQAAEDGLDVLYRDEHLVLKALPDGGYMVEHPDGTMGERVQPTWIDVTDQVVGTPAAFAPASHERESLTEVIRGSVEEIIEAPTKQREGDQPLPVPNTLRDAQSQMADDIIARRQIGIERYGSPLQPFNGRNTVLDAYEEVLDLGVYLRTLLSMREASRDQLIDRAAEVLLAEFGERSLTAHLVRGMATKVVDRLLDALQGR